MTISFESLHRFKSYLFDEEKSSHTIEKYMRDCMYFAKWLGERELCKSVLVEYKTKLCESHAPSSVNSMISSVNTFLAFLEKHNLKIKTLKIQRKIFSETSKELTKSEYEKLLCEAKRKNCQRLYYLIQTIGCTGIRISELRYITVEALRLGVATINCKGKIRQILLPRKLCRALLTYTKEQKIKSGSVFVSKNGNPLDRSNVWKMLKELCHGAGVSRDKVFPHNFRHLFARTFYAQQKDIVRLADILGHSNINTTRIYTTESSVIQIKKLQRLGLLLC